MTPKTIVLIWASASVAVLMAALAFEIAVVFGMVEIVYFLIRHGNFD